jgi:hypothetical protein
MSGHHRTHQNGESNMAYDNHRFCWHGIISTDTDKAEAFYTEVLGWQAMKVPMGDEEATMFAAGGVPRAHLGAPNMEGEPSHWSNYLRVEDVDAGTTAATENGGTVLVPPTDIPVGRFSVIQSPTGAVVSLFHEKDDTAQNAPPTEGGMHWTELNSTDIDADLAFLKGAFGITSQEMPMPMGAYHLLQSGETQVGGAMTSQVPNASFWLTWVNVANVDETIERVGNNGGQIISPVMDVPNVGRMAVCQDPTGGSFGVITPANG